MSIVATCGHTLDKIEGLGVTCARKGVNRQGENVVEHVTLCFSCYRSAVMRDEILLSEEAENAWLDGEYPDGREDLTLDLPDSTIYTLMKQAHEEDITFNQHIENILRSEIDRVLKEQEGA